jgi:uncharacterized protein involved in outer membrane biogenesis
MRRFFLLTFALLLAVVAIAAALTLYLANDEDFLKGQARKYVFELTGRQLSIDGPLELTLGRETTLEASGIRLSNAAWAGTPDMATAGLLKVGIDVPSLFSRLPVITELVITDCSLEIVRNGAGDLNWDVLAEKAEAPVKKPKDDSAPLVPVLLKSISIRDCGLLADGPDREAPLRALIRSATLQEQAGSRITAAIDGSINDEALALEGWLEPASALQHGGQLDHRLTFNVGDVSLVSSGTVAEIATLAEPEFSGHFTGPDIGKVLADYSLPPMSEGAFDFRLDLATQDGWTILDLDGDLGSLDIMANGRLDKLTQPDKGDVWAQLKGPDLQALGQALGISGLVADPFELTADAKLAGKSLHLEELRLSTPADHLDLTGDLTLSEGLPGSRLTVSLDSDDLGRWAGLVRQPVLAFGAIDVDGKLLTDDSGELSIEARASHYGSALQVAGGIGPIAGPYRFDLDVDFTSEHPSDLLKIFTRQDFPDFPLKIDGNFVSSPEVVSFNAVSLELDNNTLKVDGRLNLAEQFAGSEFELDLDIPDLFTFGQMWGNDRFPHEPVRAHGRIKPQGKGLAFQLDDGNMGEVRMKIDGSIADLEQPLGIDANFNVDLPGSAMIHWLLPDIELPEGPIKASGKLENLQDRTRLNQIRLQIGEMVANVHGEVTYEFSYDLSAQVSGPDSSRLEPLTRIDMPAESFDIAAQLTGDSKTLTIAQIDAAIGNSEASGQIDFAFGDPLRITGDITSPHLDLTAFIDKEIETEEAPQDSDRRYVFDDSDLFDMTPYGLIVKAELRADRVVMHGGQMTGVDFGLQMEDEYFSISPFTFRGSENGLFEGSFVMNGRDGTTELAIDVKGDNQLMAPWPAEGQDPATLPRGGFTAKLRGRGNTGRELVSGLDGKVRIEVGPGQLARASYSFLFNDFMTQLTDTLNPFKEDQEFTQLDCAVAAADVESGLLTLKPLVIHMRQVTVISQGTLDLKTEELDITFNSKQRRGLGISASDLFNRFIKVGGTLAAPMLEIDPAGTVVKGGLAVATAGLSIIAKSFSDRYLSSKDPCGDALKSIAKRDSKQP